MLMRFSPRALARLTLTLPILFAVAVGQASAKTTPVPTEPTEPPIHVTDVASIDVVFTPGGSGYAAITKLLAQAKTSIRVSAFHFRSRTVAEALIAAKKRGVDVAVIIDRRNLETKKNMAYRVAEADIPVLLDEAHGVTHNKYLVVDDEWVETGSFNYRDNAEYENSENLLVIRSKTLAQAYLDNWSRHAQHASRLKH